MQPEFEIWLDTHISSIVAKWIVEDFGFICKSAYVLNLHGIDDADIYKKAQAGGQIIVMTKDKEFSDSIEMQSGWPKVILLVGDNMRSKKLYTESIKPNLVRGIRFLVQFNEQTVEIYLNQ